MSDEDTNIQDNPPSVELSPDSEKPVRNRSQKRTGEKPDQKDAVQKDRPTESASENKPTETPDQPTQVGKDDDVSFSFDPNEVTESEDNGKEKNVQGGTPGGQPKQGNNQNQNRNQNKRQNFRNDGNKGRYKKKQPKQHQPNQQGKKQPKKRAKKQPRKKAIDSIKLPQIGRLLEDESLKKISDLKFLADEATGGGEPIKLNDYYQLPLQEFVDAIEGFGIKLETAPNRRMLLDLLIKYAVEHKRPILDTGLLWVTEESGAFVVHEHNNYVPHPQDFFVPECFIKQFGLKTGHMVEIQILPQEGEGCGYVVDLLTASGLAPEEIQHLAPFEDLIPYYPTERIILETPVEDLKNQDVSIRVVDALTPIGFGQRGLIVAPPRTGKTVLLQGIANSVAVNSPEADLIVLLIDERPEEVTDFRRMVKGEVIASTFDEAADNHVHVAEMVIEKARRMVEVGRNVIILLDSITRLARGYNTMMPNSGKILSGGVEASALQKPKRFFGSARNIEGGGSLTIMGTALVETGSKMDEVVFEEFKGTGNMELHLDRALSDKRIFPAINLEKSGTRKEELLYHKDELPRIYALRRAMKGVPSTEAMEMLINRMKKTTTNVEFLMQVNR